MKWICLLLVVMGTLRADDPAFYERLTPAQRAAAGIDRLTPDQIRELDRLVANVGEPSTSAVTKRASEAHSASEAGGWLNWIKPRSLFSHGSPSPAAASSPPAAAAADTPPTVAKPIKKSRPKPPPADTPVIVSHIEGKFYGWDAHSVIHLANGQNWTVADYSSYQFVHPLMSPEVRIKPVSIFGYRMEFEGSDHDVRVRPAN